MVQLIAAIVALSNLASAIALSLGVTTDLVTLLAGRLAETEPPPMTADEQIAFNELFAKKVAALRRISEMDAAFVKALVKDA